MKWLDIGRFSIASDRSISWWRIYSWHSRLDEPDPDQSIEERAVRWKLSSMDANNNNVRINMYYDAPKSSPELFPHKRCIQDCFESSSQFLPALIVLSSNLLQIIDVIIISSVCLPVHKLPRLSRSLVAMLTCTYSPKWSVSGLEDRSSKYRYGLCSPSFPSSSVFNLRGCVKTRLLCNRSDT